MKDVASSQEVPTQAPNRTKRTKYQRQVNDPPFDLRLELYRIAGVDLTDIPGVSTLTAQVVLTEIGPDVSRFRNASAFASWLGLCPEKRVPGRAARRAAAVGAEPRGRGSTGNQSWRITPWPRSDYRKVRQNGSGQILIEPLHPLGGTH
jgi:hypothetical protein